MGFGKLALTAACLLVFKACRVYGQSIATAEAISSSTSLGAPCLSGGQFIIPAIIKPVLAPEQPAFQGLPAVTDFGGFNNYAPLPPIIIDDGGDSSFNQLLYLLIFAMRGFGGGFGGYGGCGGNGGYGGGCGGCGNYGCGGCGGCGGYGGYGGYGSSGCGCGGGCGGCNYPYSGYGYGNCGCGSGDSSGYYDNCGGSCPNEINLIIRTDSASSTSSASSNSK